MDGYRGHCSHFGLAAALHTSARLSGSLREPQTEYWFVTNNLNLSAQQVSEYYHRRWDIEVFFRFIKQELNFSHLISLNKNGIEVMLYMTMITSMLLLIYKKHNNIGYKTAKRRFMMEMRKIIISEIVRRCGGDPCIVFNQIE